MEAQPLLPLHSTAQLMPPMKYLTTRLLSSPLLLQKPALASLLLPRTSTLTRMSMQLQ